MKNYPVYRFMFLFFAIFFIIGCDDDPADPVIETDGITPPASPDEVMASFEYSYTEMRIDVLASLLHEDFQMILMFDTIAQWSWPDSMTFDKSTFTVIHQNMFDGSVGLTSDGNFVHPIDTIVVERLEQQGSWVTTPADDPDFGEYEGSSGEFSIIFEFWDSANEHKFEIQHEAIFYVVPVMVDGSVRYQLIGIGGFKPYEKTDSVSWDEVLAMYR